MRRPATQLALLLALLAACEPHPRIVIHPTTAEAAARPYPALVPVAVVEAAGGPPRLLPAEIASVERRAEALLASAPEPAAASGAEIARAAALREEAAGLRAEADLDLGGADDLRARAEALRARTEPCEDPDALPPCPAPDS